MNNGCPNQASKQLKPLKWSDGKDGENEGERGMGKKSITPARSKTVHGN